MVKRVYSRCDTLSFPTQSANDSELAPSAQKVLETLEERAGPSVAKHQVLVRDYRAAFFSIKISSDAFLHGISYDDHRRLVESDPLGRLAFSETSHFVKLSDYSNSSWYAELQHRTLNIIAIVVVFQRGASSPEAPGYSERYASVSYALNKLKLLAQGTIFEANPEIVPTIMDVYLPSLLYELGYKLTSFGGHLGAERNRYSGLRAGGVSNV